MRQAMMVGGGSGRYLLVSSGGRAVLVATILAALVAFGQNVPSTTANTPSKTPCPEEAPRKVVEELWDEASTGDLLTPEGRLKLRHFFTEGLLEDYKLGEPAPRPESVPWDGAVRVFTDHWSAEFDSRISDTEVMIVVHLIGGPEPGLIDPSLRYTPPKTEHYKSGLGYRVVVTRGSSLEWVPDEKTNQLKLQRMKEIPGATAWVIKGPPDPPFATVTAAIRYVLQKRSQTTDPTIKRNADETLAKLLTMH